MKTLWISFKVLILTTFVTGIMYPLALVWLGDLLFSSSANGSLLSSNNKIIGSEWIAQSFRSDDYFWPRPSAVDYFPFPSGASNLSPSSKELLELFKKRQNFLKEKHPDTKTIPTDLLFASGSGVDPHISVEAAYYQLERVAKARKIKPEVLQLLVKKHTEKKILGVFGQERINVLKLNLAIDQQFRTMASHG
jgi:K+-transporting ATPase ATPase C chain